MKFCMPRLSDMMVFSYKEQSAKHQITKGCVVGKKNLTDLSKPILALLCQFEAGLTKLYQVMLSTNHDKLFYNDRSYLYAYDSISSTVDNF